MRKTYKLLIIMLIAAGGIYFCITFNHVPSQKEKIAEKPKPKKINRVGEHIVYEVRLGNVSLGKAEFNHLPNTILDDKEVSFMTFETKLVKFRDLEKIYSDPKSYLPLRVERQILNWPFKEKITEEYDQEGYVLKIIKHKGKKVKETVIEKEDVINNAILLPYYVRDTAELKEGYSITARLPTQEFKIELVSKEEVEVPAGKFLAYHFVSDPERFGIWISADSRRIPIKIVGSGGVMGYHLTMKEYSLKSEP
jgi:hypothetical protein